MRDGSTRGFDAEATPSSASGNVPLVRMNYAAVDSIERCHPDYGRQVQDFAFVASASLLAFCTKISMSSKCMMEVFLSDLGDKVVIIVIIYYLLHVVIIGRGRVTMKAKLN